MKTVAKLWIDNGPSFRAGADNIYCINNFQAILFFRCSASLSEDFREKGEGGKPSKLANDGWLLGSRAELPAVPHDSTMSLVDPWR